MTRKWLWGQLWTSPARSFEAAMIYTARFPRDGMGWLALACARSELNHHEHARTALRRAWRLVRDDGTLRAEVAAQWGGCCIAAGDVRGAERWYRKAIALGARSSARVYLGALFAQRGRLLEAKRMHASAARKSVPVTNADEPHLNIGLILRAEGRYAEAMHHFQKALVLDPGYRAAKAEVHDVRCAIRLAASFKARKKGTAQERLWKQIIRGWWTVSTKLELTAHYTTQFPADIHGWVARADILSAVARYQEARAALAKARDLAERKHGGLIESQWGHFHLARHELAAAEGWYRKALALRPRSSRHTDLGALLARRGAFAEARRHHRRALQMAEAHQDGDEPHLNIGLVHRAERRYDKAQLHLRKALELNPTFDAARKALADVEAALRIRASAAP